MTASPGVAPDHLGRMVTRLVPTLSRSLAEQFNVFRVMHHGTHEKQLSNVFAWLVDAEGTHELGDVFQRLFVARVNAQLPPEDRLPGAGYRVVQEADTRGADEVAAGGGRDIADIVLSRPDAAVVVENYSVSDGHGHGYRRYLAHGRAGGRRAAVAMLCMRHEAHLLGAGWEEAAVLTYAELITALTEHIGADRRWRAAHPDQHFFMRQLHQHFVEAPQAVDTDDTIDFLTALCATGESARYGRRPIAAAEDEFADAVAEHARQQFRDGRAVLGRVKRTLREYGARVLREQFNEATETGRVTDVHARFVGQWEWCVTFDRADGAPRVFIEFGPTAVVETERAPEPPEAPDYSRLFVTRHAPSGDGIDLIVQTDVTLAEVLAGLSPEDTRLRDALLEAAARPVR